MNSSTAHVSGEGFIVENIGCVLLRGATASNNILESAIREEDMLCATASLIVKICCVLLPASM